MERLSDVVNNVKERVTNPFIVSFLLSWLVVNWKITVALFWWDTQQIVDSGNLTIFQFIAREASRSESYLHPLYSALIYTVCSPFVFGGFSVLTAFAIKLSNKYIFQVSQDSPVSFEKYIELKERYSRSTDAYAKLVSEESKTLSNLETVKKELMDSIQKLNATNEAHQKEKIELSSDFEKQIKSVRDEAAQSMARSREIVKNVISPISGVWKIEYSDNVGPMVIYVKFDNDVKPLVNPSIHADISPSVVYSYRVIASFKYKTVWLIATSKDSNGLAVDFFFLTREGNRDDTWRGIERTKGSSIDRNISSFSEHELSVANS
ncbi:MAG TPA: hypothetical protein VIT44_08665 [Cyclobacteriaceae bacterium]